MEVTNETLLDFLYVIAEVGGWCCPSCRLTKKVAGGKTSGTSASHHHEHINQELQVIKDQLTHLTSSLLPISKNSFVQPTSLANMVSQKSYAQVAASEPDGDGKKPGVVDSIPGINGEIRTAILSAVHTEMLTKEERALNVVITGMKISSFASDAVQFAELCSSEFNIQPTIRSNARLGKVIEGKIQPLLVSLNSSTEVDNLIKRANLLRFSRSPQVRDRIYLNRHMTRAEALAAYNARVFRRSKVSNQSNQSNQSSTNSDDLIRLDVPLNIELDSQHHVIPAPAKVLVQGLDPTAQPFRSASPIPLSRDLEIDTSSTAQPPNSGTSN